MTTILFLRCVFDLVGVATSLAFPSHLALRLAESAPLFLYPSGFAVVLAAVAVVAVAAVGLAAVVVAALVVAGSCPDFGFAVVAVAVVGARSGL